MSRVRTLSDIVLTNGYNHQFLGDITLRALDPFSNIGSIKKLTLQSMDSAYYDGLVFDAQLLHPSTVQLAKEAHNSSLLAGSRRTVNKQMREVSTLYLNIVTH